MTTTGPRPPPERSLRALASWGPPALLSVTFLAMLAFSWGKWPDVLADFGRELYVPWRLSQGAVLGRDLEWYVTGPLSPYVNAALFAAVGPSLRVLVLLNVAVLAAIAALLFRLLRAVAGRAGATAGCFVLLTVFGFGQLLKEGNYNFVAPYSHGATHGILASLAALALLARYVDAPSARRAAASGLAVGLAFLTKPEIFVAVLAASAVPLAASAGRPRRERLRDLAAFAAAAAAPAVVAAAALTPALGVADAARLVVVPWRTLAAPGVATNAFYLSGSGLDDVAGNAAALAVTTAAAIGATALALGVDALARGRWARPGPWIAGGATAAVIAGVVPLTGIGSVGRPLPVLMAGGFVAYALAAARTRAVADRGRYVVGLMLSAFAGALLLKMPLNSRIYHYGFVLAMPATTLVAAWITGTIPDLLRARRGGGSAFRGVAIAAVAVLALASIRVSRLFYADKRYPVGGGADTFLADDRGRYVAGVLSWLDANARRDDTVAVLPEGIMINYLARRPTPVPYLSFLSDSLAYYGSEEPIRRAFLAAPPDLIVLTQRDSGEYGPRFFGFDYGTGLSTWIAAQYAAVHQLGAVPGRSRRYGMTILKRRW